MSLAMLLETGKTDRLKRGFSYLGQNTKPIMILHLLCFVPVKLVYILVTGLPITELKQFPVILNSDLSYMWLICTVTGITLSLLLNKLYLVIKNLIIKPKKVQA